MLWLVDPPSFPGTSRPGKSENEPRPEAAPLPATKSPLPSTPEPPTPSYHTQAACKMSALRILVPVKRVIDFAVSPLFPP